MTKKYTLKPFEGEPRKLRIDYRGELNDEQFAAVTQSAGSSLVLAGAGSGKTRTLVYRLAYLIEQGVPPDRILLVTFTNKASKEMLSRIEALLKSKPKGLWGGTFHHVGNRMLRMYGKYIDIPSDFIILDSQDAKDIVKACLSDLNFPRDRYFPRAEVIHKIISLAANLHQNIAETIDDRFSYIDSSAADKIIKIADMYQQKKKQSNALDYDDLLTKWHELLQHPEVQPRLAQKFQYILVDEYQDTNYIQGEIVSLLSGGNANVLAVGDDSQSIYSFRGATVQNILDFPKAFANSEMFKLESNYRSTPEILELANASIKYNTNQFPKKLRSHQPSAEKPVVAALYDVEQQADFVSQRILELQRDGVSLNDIAVLFRAHYQSLEVEMEMNKRSIPYDMRGGLRFFEQAHIKDVIAYLKALHNVQDEISWLRILRMQPGVGEVNARKIWSAVAACGTIDQALTADMGEMLSASKALQGWEKMRSLMIGLNEIARDDVAALVSYVLKAGYAEYVKINFENAQDRVEDLEQLVSFAGSYDSLEKILEDVALSEGFKGQTIAGYEDGPDEAVTLTTVHQAKGLEWKVVFLIGLADGQFPHAKVYEHPEEIDEERRLFYVAVTRAKEQLYLTYPMMTKRGDILSRPSKFLQELPEGVYEQWEVGDETSYDDGEEVIQLDEEDGGGILDKYLRQR